MGSIQQTRGEWKIFTGNEIGILLADWVWKNRPQKDTPTSKYAMLNTTVSSKMIKAMAEKEGFYYEVCFVNPSKWTSCGLYRNQLTVLSQETLTGFKWLGNVADELSRKGYHFLYAFEEAIGNLCHPTGYLKRAPDCCFGRV
jgi:phosphomannomutase